MINTPHQPARRPRVASARPGDADQHHQQRLRGTPTDVNSTDLKTLKEMDMQTTGRMWDGSKRLPAGQPV